MIFVCPEGGAWVTGGIEHDEVCVFLDTLLLCIRFLIIGFQCEGYDVLVFLFHLSQCGSDVVGRFQTQEQIVLLALNLSVCHLSWFEISHCGTEDSCIHLVARRVPICLSFESLRGSLIHLLTALHVDAVDVLMTGE